MILQSWQSLCALYKEVWKFLYGLCQDILFHDSKGCLDLFYTHRPSPLENGIAVDLHESLPIFLDQLVLDLSSALLVRLLLLEVERGVIYLLCDCGRDFYSQFLELWLACVSETSQSYGLGSTNLESSALDSRSSQSLSVCDQGDKGDVSSATSLSLVDGAIRNGQIFGRDNKASFCSFGIDDHLGGPANFLVGLLLAGFALISAF